MVSWSAFGDFFSFTDMLWCAIKNYILSLNHNFLLLLNDKFSKFFVVKNVNFCHKNKKTLQN